MNGITTNASLVRSLELLDDDLTIYAREPWTADETMKEGEPAGWEFQVEEVSAGVYRVRGADKVGRSVEATGTDPEQLLQKCKRAAAEIADAHHGEQRGIRATTGQTGRVQGSSSGAAHSGRACAECANAQGAAGGGTLKKCGNDLKAA